MNELSIHEVANLFPAMSADEYAELLSDIRANGLHEALWTYQGALIDGRHRYRACQELGIEPTTREWDGRGSLVTFVVGLNLHRRHLTSSQRAMLALEVEKLFAAETHVGRPAKNNTRIGEIFPQFPDLPESNTNNGRAKDQAAAIVGTNSHYVTDAKKIAASAPELVERVKSGDMSIPEAKKLASAPVLMRTAAIEKMASGQAKDVRSAMRQVVAEDVREAAALPAAKYRVVYADPPWKYGNTMPDYFAEQADHYPLMTVAEIAAMPICDLTEDNAVLFLWVTSPILAESFTVITGWGFTYKASFVWDKIKHNMGHYNSVRHEFLLIATRGSCQPDIQRLHDSVVSEERTAHSVKPETFRQIIDEIYPHGKRIELFARRQVEGWDSYGNQLS